MRIGIHQPNFLPWMGYFYKMSQCDVFVFLDHVEFTKKSYTKRVKIHKANNLLEDQYLIIPLMKHSDHAAINSLRIVDDRKWQKKISTQIYQTYHKAPFYNQIGPIVDRFFNDSLESNSFSEFNIEIIKYIAELLAINPDYISSSDLDLAYTDQGVNLDILTSLKGTNYISGMGAKKYQNESAFIENDIQLKYSDYPSFFNDADLPHHFLNKSVLSYLAFYDVEELKGFLGSK